MFGCRLGVYGNHYDSVALEGGPVENIAARMLAAHMERAFAENPRGELYRTLSNEDLLNRLQQNIAEVRLALAHRNDVGDKLADCGNYIAFLLRNYVEPLSPVVRVTAYHQASEALAGAQLTWMQAEQLIRLIRSKVPGTKDLLAHGR